MRLYRVTWVQSRWSRFTPKHPFHPLCVPLDRQGGGRFDNPHRYAALYGSDTAQGAVGETFGNSAVWLRDEVTRSKESHPRCLVGYEVPDDAALVDLDDPRVLIELGLRPSDIVRRDRSHTQEVAQRLWLAHLVSGPTRGIRWWSYWRPEWINVVVWSDIGDDRFADVTVVDVAELTADHPAVLLAADVLPRQIG